MLQSTFEMKALTVTDLQKNYGTVEALKGLSFEVNQGEIFGLIGPDGAGKTTLIRILTSLLYADKGTARVMGLDPVKDFKKLRQIFGYMPGRFSLYQDLTVEENLSLFASLFETTIEKNYHLIRDIYVQIEPFKKRRAGALSGGMKQKLALSCAMIHKPEILFLDEPTTGVDPVSRKEFWEMLRKLNAEGLTIIVSTPYMDEADQCHRIALMQNGQVMGIDSPTEMVKRFDKVLFSVTGPNKFGIMQTLKTYPHAHSVFSFGSDIHYTDQRANFSEHEITEYLTSKGFQDSKIARITPGIEDTFMALMTAHD